MWSMRPCTLGSGIAPVRTIGGLPDGDRSCAFVTAPLHEAIKASKKASLKTLTYAPCNSYDRIEDKLSYLNPR